MAKPLERPWTLDEFFAWQEGQPDRYELVNGFPLKMMAGAKNVHDIIVVNILAELRALLRGSGYRPFTGDGAVETYPGQIRRPDVGVDCGRSNPEGYKAEGPRLVAEVFSPTTRDFDSFSKLSEYMSIAGLAHIVFVEPNQPLVSVWSRDDGGGWSDVRISDLGAKVDLSALGVSLAMQAIYEDVEFPTVFRPVSTEKAP